MRRIQPPAERANAEPTEPSSRPFWAPLGHRKGGPSRRPTAETPDRGEAPSPSPAPGLRTSPLLSAPASSSRGSTRAPASSAASRRAARAGRGPAPDPRRRSQALPRHGLLGLGPGMAWPKPRVAFRRPIHVVPATIDDDRPGVSGDSIPGASTMIQLVSGWIITFLKWLAPCWHGPRQRPLGTTALKHRHSLVLRRRREAHVPHGDV